MPPLDPELDPHFEEAARLNNLDPMLLRALASGEGGNDPNATSPKGAGGLMQIMPETASHYKIADPYDPVQAIYGAANILNDNLTKAEAAKAAGANIDPTDEALRSYFAGPGGGNRGAQTAAYPGYIAQKYLALQNGQELPAPPPVSGIGALAAAKATPMPAPGAVATNAIPPANAPDTFAPAPDRVAALAALSGQGTAPTPQVRLASALEPGLTDQEADARRAAGAQAENAMLLDPNLNPSAAGGRVPAGAPQQVAQAAPDPEIADLLAANRKMFGGQPPGAAQTTQPTTSAAPSVGTATGSPVLNVQGLLDTYNHYRGFPAGVPLATQALGMIQKMTPEGYQLFVEPSQNGVPGMARLIPTSGGPYDPTQAESLEHAKAIGHTTGTPQTARQGESIGMETKPGETPPLTFHEQFQSPRLPEATVSAPPPPGSPPGTPPTAVTMPGGAPAIASAAIAGEAGRVAANPTLDAEKVASEDFGKLREAYQGNQGSIQNLQNFLNAAAIVGTGKGTGLSGEAAAWLKSINVDPQKLSLADPAEVEKMRKASTQAVFGAIKGVSSRPAFQEFAMLDKAMPNPDLQPEANRAIAASLLGRMQWENNMFEAWNKSRRETGSHLAFDMPEWAKANPIQGFQHTAYEGLPQIPNRGVVGNPAPNQSATPTFQEGQTARNPQGGPPLIYRGGRWVPQ
jgi:hypothetical protein